MSKIDVTHLGESVIDEIVRGCLFTTINGTTGKSCDDPLIHVWSSGAAEQIEARIKSVLDSKANNP